MGKKLKKGDNKLVKFIENVHSMDEDATLKPEQLTEIETVVSDMDVDKKGLTTKFGVIAGPDVMDDFRLIF